MKEPAYKIVKKLSRDGENPSPRRHARATKAPAKSITLERAPNTDVTGQTVFDDRALRFRNLTLSEADLGALIDASSIEGAFKIRVARHTGAKRDAGALVEQRYVTRGYTIPAAKPNPHLSTFIAYDEGQIVGTVGVRLDSPEGLSADELYREEIDVLRARGYRLCEFTRLAVDRTAASKPVLAGLFHTAYLYAAVIRDCTHAVIEVNPRHVEFYGNALEFVPAGPERLNRRVDAPAVLLHASFAAIAEGLYARAGKSKVRGAKRSLFYYGFPPDDEQGVLHRLRQLVDRH